MGDRGMSEDRNSDTRELLRAKSESTATVELKWAAWRWLWEVAGCRSIGFEVKLEGPFGRIADLVGVGKQNVVYLIEVKSSRADLRRDDHSATDRARVKAEHAALADAAELAAAILDDARKEALAEVGPDEDWRSTRGYQAARRELDAAREKLERRTRSLATFSTKFHDPRFLACADYHCIMAPAGLISINELPPYWGLLDATGNTVVDPTLKQVRRNTTHVLRAISKANTRDIRKLCVGQIAPDADSDDESDGDVSGEETSAEHRS